MSLYPWNETSVLFTWLSFLYNPFKQIFITMEKSLHFHYQSVVDIRHDRVAKLCCKDFFIAFFNESILSSIILDEFFMTLPTGISKTTLFWVFLGSGLMLSYMFLKVVPPNDYNFTFLHFFKNCISLYSSN